ncbi:MAG: GTP-binding protein [Patescibacteria group bacterium]|nr:GTP-binding protein [Patescibacteria group bacterium]
MKKRPPIVIILGHIDHGKSTLLDTIQKTKIVDQEIGGITQKVRAYEIIYKDEKITFIDTPGHEAFFKLREKGSQIADIAILIIAADEGIKPQTKECLNYIVQNNLPFIIAINKIDKPNARPEIVKKQLAELNFLVEEWGGQIPAMEISAAKNINIDQLLDLILLLAEILELKYDENKKGEGYVLEVMKDSKKGLLVLGILIDGVLKVGDYLTTSTAGGKVKFLENIFNQRIDQSYPSSPVIINGFEKLPQAGEIFRVIEKDELEKTKKELLEKEIAWKKQIVFNNHETTINLNLIIKTDLVGSLEAIEYLLEKLSKEFKINIKIVKADVGQITTDDLKLAKQTDSILISFNLNLTTTIYEEIKNLNLILIEAKIIYEIEEKLKDLIEVKEEEVTHKGELEILALFSKSSQKQTIGGRVINGKLRLNDKFLIIRGGVTIGKGKIISLEKNKVKVDEINEGEICGLIVQTKNDIIIGDHLLV